MAGWFDNNGMRLDSNGIRYVNKNYTGDEISRIIQHRKEFVNEIPPYPSNFEEKGIVICAGGLSYFTCAWVLIHILRKKLGCTLPIQLWYIGNEMTQTVIDALKPLDVTCHDILDYEDITISLGYQLKALSILHSSFKEVLYLDADNVCVQNPEFLFDIPAYKNCGSIFWPDFWQTDHLNQIWKITETQPIETKEFESGQLIINKELCWKELNLAVYFNRFARIYYKLLLGDKDTFKFAWMILNTKFYFIEHDLSSCGYITSDGSFSGNTMVQYAPDGSICFLHRNLLKWEMTKPDEKVWKLIKSFKKNALFKQYINSISKEKLSQIDLVGDTEEVLFETIVGDIEGDCLKYLRELRAMQVYKDFFIETFIFTQRRCIQKKAFN